MRFDGESWEIYGCDSQTQGSQFGSYLTQCISDDALCTACAYRAFVGSAAEFATCAGIQTRLQGGMAALSVDTSHSPASMALM